MDDLFSTLRREYSTGTLEEAGLDGDPMAQFAAWFRSACEAGVAEANAMDLCTVDPDHRPSSRIVLLKHFDNRGFVFFTNYGSRKARAIDANANVAITFFWQPLERQVRAMGAASRIDPAHSDAYFRGRPRDAQIAAWVSCQSDVAPDRATIDARFRERRAEFENHDVPRPENWGGFCIVPNEVEFWQGHASRLHDRFRYRRIPGGWSIERLWP